MKKVCMGVQTHASLCVWWRGMGQGWRSQSYQRGGMA